MLTVKKSAPGSCMLMGEHAVLHGFGALSLSLKPCIEVEISPRKDTLISIQSELGTFTGKVNALPKEPDFIYVTETILYFLFGDNIEKNHHASTADLTQRSHTGFNLDITSQFPVKSGLGSSTAVVVATLKALAAADKQHFSQKDLFQHSLNVIRKVQTQASGADVAASVFEGCVYYKIDQSSDIPIITQLKPTPQIDLLFSGTKVPTSRVLNEINRMDENYVQCIYKEIGKEVEIGKISILNEDWQALALALFNNQRLMEDLGLDTPELTFARETLMQKPGIIAAKISGAGMGDYALGLIDGMHKGA